MLDDVDRRKLSLPSGLEIALIDWGGEGPVALLHHATGFCAGVWDAVARGLRERFHVIGMDARGHGDSSAPPVGGNYLWTLFGEDVAAVARLLAAESGVAALPLGIGHSFGGTALLLGSTGEAPPFERLVLVDPVFPPPDASVPDPGRGARGSQMVKSARKRRSHWESRAEARAWWAEKPLFAPWIPSALDAYVAEGLRDAAEGGVVLKCTPEVEAEVFGVSFESDIWSAVEQVRVPTLLLRAARGDFPPEIFHALVARMPDARLSELDAGHLVPMERPELVVEAILADYPEPSSKG